MPLHVLLPATTRFTLLDGVPPLGALLKITVRAEVGGTHFLHELLAAKSQHWCPIFVPSELGQLWGHDLAEIGVVPWRVLTAPDVIGADELRRLLRFRPIPTVEELLTILESRLGTAAGAPVRALFQVQSEGSAHRRALREAGLPNPKFWWELLSLCVCLADALQTGDTMDVIARRHGVVPKTLADQKNRCFGLAWKELLAFGAWEPALEHALRYHCLVTLPESLRPSRTQGF